MTEETDPKWLMNENDVVQLLGEPDVRKAPRRAPGMVYVH
jgi:hypothetical protein